MSVIETHVDRKFMIARCDVRVDGCFYILFIWKGLNAVQVIVNISHLVFWTLANLICNEKKKNELDNSNDYSVS